MLFACKFFKILIYLYGGLNTFVRIAVLAETSPRTSARRQTLQWFITLQRLAAERRCGGRYCPRTSTL